MIHSRNVLFSFPKMKLVFVFLLIFPIYGANWNTHSKKRSLQLIPDIDQNERLKSFFAAENSQDFDIPSSLIDLIMNLSTKYLEKCTPILLYDMKPKENIEDIFINDLLRRFNLPRIHGDAQEKSSRNSNLFRYNHTCKVIVVTKSSQWRVHKYLSERSSQKIVNLLVISKSEMVVEDGEQTPYVLYTHKLYIDAIASSKHVVLTSWMNGRFTRPNITLFPKKMSEGFAGHRFTISLAHFPPFVIKRTVDVNDNIVWDGLEVRLIKILAKTFNFTTDFIEAPNSDDLVSADDVVEFIKAGRANLGISGIFVSNEIAKIVDISNMYHQDCAAFITLTSTALPRYRAIMGPFHWTVWLSLTLIYLFAIFPLNFSHKHTLKPLLKNPEEIGNMFWYVFGNFTNAFTFNRGDSWTNSDKIATRVFIGFYWIFTIIISSCYTGSIIAFVTLPVYPETVDTVSKLLQGHYRIGTLDKSGWVNRFENSSDPMVEKLMSEVDLVPTVEEGVKNTTKALFWPYAFLGSRANLDYIIRTKFVPKKRRAILHIGDECLTTYSIAMIYPKNSEYGAVLSAGLDRVVQAGFLKKMERDVEWLVMRSSTGTLLAANKGKASSLTVEDRALTLDDTQGMFLLLGIGFIMSIASLFFEIFGGCFSVCKKKERFKSGGSLPSNPRSYNGITPKQRTQFVTTINIYNMDMTTINNNDFNRQLVVNTEVLKDGYRSNDSNDGSLNSAEIENKIDDLFDFEEYFGEKTIDDLYSEK